MVAGLAVWVLYAYRNPHTTSGQILIRVSNFVSFIISNSVFCSIGRVSGDGEEVRLDIQQQQYTCDEFLKNVYHSTLPS